MRYTIITPTLLRPTLKRTCDSLDAQTYTGWQHLVVVDTLERDPDLLESVAHPQRVVTFCERPHDDWAATCRLSVWLLAKGDYLLYIDDDNYLADDRVLESLLEITKPVALIPLLYRGAYSSPLPIAVGSSDGNGLMVRREIGQWPQDGNRDADGHFIKRLTDENEYEVYLGRALVVYEEESRFARR